MGPKAALALAALLASPLALADWQRFARSEPEGKTTYFDPATKTRTGTKVRIWSLTEYDKPSRGASSLKMHNEFDCVAEKARTLAYSWHAEKAGRGEVLFSREEESEWVQVNDRPTSAGRVEFVAVCN